MSELIYVIPAAILLVVVLRAILVVARHDYASTPRTCAGCGRAVWVHRAYFDRHDRTYYCARCAGRGSHGLIPAGRDVFYDVRALRSLWLRVRCRVRMLRFRVVGK